MFMTNDRINFVTRLLFTIQSMFRPVFESDCIFLVWMIILKMDLKPKKQRRNKTKKDYLTEERVIRILEAEIMYQINKILAVQIL